LTRWLPEISKNNSEKDFIDDTIAIMSRLQRAALSRCSIAWQLVFWFSMMMMLCWWCSLRAQTPDADIDERLIAGLSDPSFKVRVQAAILIGKKRVLTATAALRNALQDPHDAVQAAAAVALGKLGHQPSRPELCSLLGHSNPLVSQAAEKALGLLDQARGPPKALVNTAPASQSATVSPRIARSLDRILRESIAKQTTLVLSAGEDTVLSGEKLAAHLRSRGLRGYQLQPRISTLTMTPRGAKILFICKVSILVASLERMRMEYSASGEASAEMADPTADEREDLVNTLLKAATDAALDQIVEYVGRQHLP
jgi:HEAT repeats